MVDQPLGDSDADFELARRAVDMGWLTREQVEVALLEVELAPSTRLLSRLPLTPDQLRELETPAPALPPELIRAAANPVQRVAHYILSEHHWAGGMGKVVKAWDTRLSRWVALKFLKRIGDERLRANFVEEARLAAGLAHPNIAAIHEIGEHEGAPFIAMQFIDGRTLEEARRGMKPRETARIIRDAAQAVAYAHERGIIHRDLKPSNVMLDGSGRVFVMDFGLAAHTEVMGSRQALGAPRTLSGTPEYVSPEQAKGVEADELTDVHGLGATLYDLLTGSRPNSGKTLHEILKNLDGAERVPPRALNPRIEADLEAIVLKCLDKDPSRRYPSAKDLSEDLERYLNRDPIAAHRPNVIYRLRLKLAKLKLAVTAAITAVVLAGVLGWWAFVGSPGTESTRLYADAMNLWADVLRSVGVPGDPEGIRMRAKKAREGFERAIHVREEAKSLWMKGRCLELEGKGDEALEALERAYKLDPQSDDTRLELAKVLLLKYKSARGVPDVFTTIGVERSKSKFQIGRLPAETDVQRGYRERGESLLRMGSTTAGTMSLMKGLVLMGKGAHELAADALEAYCNDHRWDVDSLALQGICRYFAKDFQRAGEAFNRLVSLLPNARSLGWRGTVNGCRGFMDEAIADFTKAIALDPGSAKAYSDRGAAQLNKGRVDEAIQDLTKAITLDPGNARAYARRGAAKRIKGLTDEAIEDATKAISLNPQDAEVAYYNRGLAKRDKGLIREAIEDFTKAIESAPEFALALLVRGNSRSDLGETRMAIEDFSRAIEADPDYAEARVNRGIARAMLGLLDEAMEDYERAIGLDPNLAKAYVNRGAAKFRKGRPDEGMEDLDRAIKMDDKDPRAYHTRGLIKAGKNQIEEALADYDKAIQLDPGVVDFYLSRGALWNNRKRMPDRAIQDFDKAVSLDPGCGDAYYNRGIAKHAQGLFEEAIRDFMKAIELNPKDAATYHVRGQAKRALRLFDEALADFTKSIELNPNEAKPYLGRGTVLMDAKRLPDLALKDFEKAILLDPKSSEAYHNRAVANAAKGLDDKAIADYSRAIELDPNADESYVCRANSWTAKGLLDEALEDLSKAIKLNPKSPAAHFGRGLAKQRKGLLDDAIADYTQAIKLNPRHAEAYANRGNTKVRAGRVEDAVADWEQALRVAPQGWHYREPVRARITARGLNYLLKDALKRRDEKSIREMIEKLAGIVESNPKTYLAIDASHDIASGHAILGDKASALDWLEKSVEHGWNDVAHLEKCGDVHSLRGEERFKKLVARLKSK